MHDAINEINPNSTVLVTLSLDPESQNFFQRLRDQYFPPDRNIVPAHVTLFHKLPESSGEKIKADIQTVVQRPAFDLHVTSIMNTGSGVSYKLESPEFCDLHKQLRNQWLQWLTPQDRQGFRPHIVVQNKVSVETAKRTYEVLQGQFQTFTARSADIILWRYLGGPWEELESFRFTT